jgi:integrase/recombinase XerD
MKGLTRQMKTIDPKIEETILYYISQNSRNPTRDRTIFLLSIKSGLRSKEISKLKWKHILDHEGKFMDSIHLTNDLSKGKNGGRIIPINSRLKSSLMDLLQKKRNEGEWMVSFLEEPIITTQRNRRTHTSPQTITNFFHHLYRNMGLMGYGSHSGRRTFITRTSRKINEVGGSMKDIQYLSGHSSLQTTQRYIEHDPDSHRKIVEII